jgi:hypothetical protein
MEIQLTSFILGIVSVLVIAMAVVSVYSIVKVMKLKQYASNTQIWAAQEFERIRKDIDDRYNETIRGIDETNKSIDSRCDKLYEKIIKNKSPLKTMIERHPELDNDEFKSGILQILNKEDEGNDLRNRILTLMNK